MIDTFTDLDFRRPRFIVSCPSADGSEKRRAANILDPSSLSRLKPLFEPPSDDSDPGIVVHFAGADTARYALDERIDPLVFKVLCGENYFPVSLQAGLLESLAERLAHLSSPEEKLGGAEGFFFEVRQNLEFTPWGA